MRLSTQMSLIAACLVSLGLLAAGCAQFDDPSPGDGSTDGPSNCSHMCFDGDQAQPTERGTLGTASQPLNAPPTDRTIIIEGTDSTLAEYYIEVDGDLDGSDLESHDDVDGNVVNGRVQADNKQDVFDFSGDLVEFDVEGTAAVYIDGTQVKGGSSTTTHELVFRGMDYSYSEYWITTEPGSNLRGDGDLEGGDSITNYQASGKVQAPNKDDTFLYEGGLEELKLDGTQRVLFDGQIIAGGPKKKVEDDYYYQPTIGLTIHTSKDLIWSNGRSGEQSLALYAAKAFDDAGYNYEITYNLAAQGPPDQTAHCSGDANDWWRDKLNNGNVDVTAKDSNVLMLASDGGGCGAVTGWYATTPGNYIDNTRSWTSIGTGNWHQNMHANLHEIGHNLGASHDHDNSKAGAQHWGWGYNNTDSSGKGWWHRTPTVAGNGADNQCGTYIESRQYNPVKHHQTYNSCATNKFDIK
jgi:hypothetical protein